MSSRIHAGPPAELPPSATSHASVRSPWKAPVLAAGGAALAWSFTRILAVISPGGAGRIGAWIDFMVTRPLSLVTGIFPFSAAEAFGAAYLVWIAAAASLTVRSVGQGRRKWRDALAGGARRLIRDGGVLGVMFFGVWGLNYARAGFAAEAGWTEWDGIDIEELASLVAISVDAGNSAYFALHGSRDAGIPTTLGGDFRGLEAAIDTGWVRATELLSLSPAAAAPYGRVKRPLTSDLLLRLGISGIYVPFTAEAHVPRGPPATRLPISIAHEKAHQRGFTGEADANFLGYVASALAPDPLARYAAALEAQSQLLAPLLLVAPDEARRIVERRYPGVRRDLEDRRAFNARYAGPVRDAGNAVNDGYLRAAGVRAGTADYRQSAWLIVELSRRNGGDPMPMPAGVRTADMDESGASTAEP